LAALALCASAKADLIAQFSFNGSPMTAGASGTQVGGTVLYSPDAGTANPGNALFMVQGTGADYSPTPIPGFGGPGVGSPNFAAGFVSASNSTGTGLFSLSFANIIGIPSTDNLFTLTFNYQAIGVTGFQLSNSNGTIVTQTSLTQSDGTTFGTLSYTFTSLTAATNFSLFQPGNSNGSFAIDNLTLTGINTATVVPEPASVALPLFGALLGGFAFLRRKNEQMHVIAVA
jgi:hypothetical protein